MLVESDRIERDWMGAKGIGRNAIFVSEYTIFARNSKKNYFGIKTCKENVGQAPTCLYRQ
jgi:hypothetical protein